MIPSIPVVDIRDAFFEAVFEIAKNDPRLIFLTADAGAWALENFRRELPKQFINVGIAEQNMVSVSCGLALAGKKPMVFAISAFLLERSYEQIKNDLCQMNLPVVLVGSGPGFCYGPDGPTHHSLHEIAHLRCLENIDLYSPCDQFSAYASAKKAIGGSRPAYVSLDKGCYSQVFSGEFHFSENGFFLSKGKDLLIICIGTIVHSVIRAAQELNQAGIDVGVFYFFKIGSSSLEEKTPLIPEFGKYKRVLCVEEQGISGGMGSLIMEWIWDRGLGFGGKCLRVPRGGRRIGSREWLRESNNLGIETIVLAAKNEVGCIVG